MTILSVRRAPQRPPPSPRFRSTAPHSTHSSRRGGEGGEVALECFDFICEKTGTDHATALVSGDSGEARTDPTLHLQTLACIQ